MGELSHRIEAIALDFGERFAMRHCIPPITCEQELKRMVICASIASGVRYEIAETIAALLPENPTTAELQQAARGHRFPNQTGKRLSALFENDQARLKTVVRRVVEATDYRATRRSISAAVDGLGPKQSSFLLTMAGHGHRLAVLDRHILRFLTLTGVIDRAETPRSWNEYETIESDFLSYADRHGIPADALDAAIWITMKAAGREVRACGL